MTSSTKRRSSNELLEDIMKYLTSVDRSVNLNDIAIAIGSNTKVIRRWMELIYKIQNSPDVLFEDEKNLKMRFTSSKTSNSSYQIQIYQPKELADFEIKRWLNEKGVISENLFLFTKDQSKSDIITFLADNIDPTLQLYLGPSMVLDLKHKITISKVQIFYLINGYNQFITESLMYQNQNDEQSNRELLIQVLKSANVNDLSNIFQFDFQGRIIYHSLFPISLQIDAIEGISITKYQDILMSWLKTSLTDLEIEIHFKIGRIPDIIKKQLKNNVYGELALSRNNYLTNEPIQMDLKIEPLPTKITNKNFLEMEKLFWQIIRLLESGYFQQDNFFVLRIHSLLIESGILEAIVLSNYMSHLLLSKEIAIIDVQIEINNFSFYDHLNSIAKILHNLSRDRSIWVNIGRLQGLQKFCIEKNYIYLNSLITRKLAVYGTHPSINGILLSNFLYLSLKFAGEIGFSGLWQMALTKYMDWQFLQGSIDTIDRLMQITNLQVTDIIEESIKFQLVILFYKYVSEKIDFVKNWFETIKHYKFKIISSTRHLHLLRLLISTSEGYFTLDERNEFLNLLKSRESQEDYFSRVFGSVLGVQINALFQTSFIELYDKNMIHLANYEISQTQELELLETLPLVHDSENYELGNQIHKILRLRNAIINRKGGFGEELTNLEVTEFDSPLTSMYYVTCYAYSDIIGSNYIIRKNIRRLRSFLDEIDILQQETIFPNFIKLYLTIFERGKFSFDTFHKNHQFITHYHSIEQRAHLYLKFIMLRDLIRLNNHI